MALFHLNYPEATNFFKWDELGCLCRALGFPSGIFQNQLETHKDEIHQHDESGISSKTLQRVWDLKLMFKPLHRSCNMHTADWNTCTFTTALYLLTHRALSFQDLHNIRVAYMAYEHIDMKGMVLDKHTLLRTLKMCGRTIAPLKLMHRIKHMKGSFEEKGRIQLYEFFNLILWCDMYTSYKPEDMETSSGKEEELFRLVDFHRLLTHHDERMARTLDATYLQEEWDFGKECLGPKDLFKEPVVNTDARVAQAHYHQTKYRHLKNQVGRSQKRVYRAHAGTIRARPVSAPDLDEYRHVDSVLTKGSTTATQVYENVQRRLHSAPSRASMSLKLDRPSLPEHHRAQTPQVVTPRDLTDVRLKMDNLSFDMNTLGVRCELQIEKEMDFYIPGYMEKLANRRPEPAPVPEPEKKPLHWTSKIVNNLAYPRAADKASHHKSCDARHRGWQKVTKRQGTHVILTSQAHPNSEHGKLYTKMEQSAMEPVQYLHPDYVIRHTPKSALLPAPASSPRSTKSSGSKKQMISTGPKFDFKSLKNNNNNNNKNDNDDENEMEKGGESNENKKEKDKTRQQTKPKVGLEFFHSKYLNDESTTALTMNEGKQSQTQAKTSTTTTTPARPPSLSAKSDDNVVTNGRKVLQPQTKHLNGVEGRLNDLKGIQTISDEGSNSKDDVPVPFMEHSRPKIVGVGQIGTISLLESIQESRDLEDQFIEVDMMKKKKEIGKKEEEGEKEEKDKEGENSGDDSEDDNDDIDDAEELSKSLKLNLKRDVKSQPCIKSKCYGDVIVPKRKTRSAPSVSSSSATLKGVGTPRKISSSHKKKRGLKSSNSSGRCKSAGEKQSLRRQVSGISGGSMADDDDVMDSSSTATHSTSYDCVTTASSLSTTADPLKFRSTRGSVTSEENESVSTRQNMATRNSSSCKQLPSESVDNKQRYSRNTNNNNNDNDEVESFYSDALTLPSSSELTDLESHTSRHLSALQDIPDISVDFGESIDSGKKMMGKRMGGHHVQFDALLGGGGRGEGSTLSPLNIRPGVLSSCSDRKEGFRLPTDFRDYLSDSEVHNSGTGGNKRVFSKETRGRLISRVENAISPDLRTMLLSENNSNNNTSNNKISIPAT